VGRESGRRRWVGTGAPRLSSNGGLSLALNPESKKHQRDYGLRLAVFLLCLKAKPDSLINRRENEKTPLQLESIWLVGKESSSALKTQICKNDSPFTTVPPPAGERREKVNTFGNSNDQDKIHLNLNIYIRQTKKMRNKGTRPTFPIVS